MRVKTLLAPIASVSLLLVGSGVASAHTVAFDSQVTGRFTEQPGAPDISSDAGRDYFAGRVNSPRAACRANRFVRVYRSMPGADPSQLTKTDAEGFWRINSEDPPNGTYYVRAPRKYLANTAAHQHVCKVAVSRDVVVTDQP